MTSEALLSTVLDVLVPPRAEVAGAGGLGLAAQIPAAVADAVLGALPAGFAGLDAAAMTEALKAVEAARPDQFGELVRQAYMAYYRDTRVLARIEQATGYAARPPQPEGYTLEPLDPTLLDVVKARGPQYRDTREATS